MSAYGEILLCICLWDLMTTTVCLNLFSPGDFFEAGPILSLYFNQFGIIGLVVGKLLINGLSIFILEALGWLPNQNKKRLKFLYLVAIWSYVLVYVIGVLIANQVL